MEINLGLFNTFRKEGIPHANLYINDPDEDTCLATWLLMNNEQVRNHAQPQINRLVYCEDHLDCTAGAYPFGDTSFRRQMAWIFEPYNDARFSGKLAQMDAPEMRNIIEAVHGRVTKHVYGKGEEIALEGRYKKIGGGDGWMMTQETGPASRLAMFNDGVQAYIALVTEKDDGSFVYVAGRASKWIPFPIKRIFDRCNREDVVAITESNKWNGGDTVGGSPRVTGSRIPPSQLQQIVDEEVQKANGDILI